MNYCAVDLHGNNGFYGIIDEDGKRVFRKRIANDMSSVLEAFIETAATKVIDSIHTENWDGVQKDLKKFT